MYFPACSYFPVSLNRSLLPGEKLGDTQGTRWLKGPFPSSFSALPTGSAAHQHRTTFSLTQALTFWPSKKIPQPVSGSCCPEGGICILLATGNGKTSSPGIKAQKEGSKLGEGALSLQQSSGGQSYTNFTGRGAQGQELVIHQPSLNPGGQGRGRGRSSTESPHHMSHQNHK